MCQSKLMDRFTYVFIPTMKIGRFSRNLTSRRFKAIPLYLTMCGFKILSLAVTKVLVAGRLLCAKADHMPTRAPTHCKASPTRGPKLGKSQSKQNEKETKSGI